MNLGQIRQEIADALSFDPTSSAYDESVTRRVNNVYRALCSGAPWMFLEREVDYTVLADLDGSDPNVVARFERLGLTPGFRYIVPLLIHTPWQPPGSPPPTQYTTDSVFTDQQLGEPWDWRVGAELHTPSQNNPSNIGPNDLLDTRTRRLIGANWQQAAAPFDDQVGTALHLINEYMMPRVQYFVSIPLSTATVFITYLDDDNTHKSLIKHQPNSNLWSAGSNRWTIIFTELTLPLSEEFSDLLGDGVLAGTGGGSGTVNYETGEVAVTFGILIPLGATVELERVDTDVIIKHRRWPLPPDCVDLLGILNRQDQYGPLSGLSQWEENQYPLYETETSTPVAFVLDGQSAQEWRGDLKDRGNYQDHMGDTWGQLAMSRPPDVSEVVMVGTTGFPGKPDRLDPTISYDYMFTYASCGLESGPSQTVSATPGAGNDQLQIRLPLVNYILGRYEPGAPAVAEGMGVYTKVYRRKQATEPNGPQGAWYYVGWPMSTIQVPFGSQPNVRPNNNNVWYDGIDETNLVTRYDESLPTAFVRLYPKPDKTYRLRMRYHYRPPLLEEDRDVPHIPQEYQSLLIHLVVEQIAAQTDGTALAIHHAKLSASLLEKMRRRYLTSRSTNTRRQLWGTRHAFLIKPKIEFTGS